MRCVDATIAHDQKFAKLCDSEHLTTFRGRITLFVICEILWPIVAGQLVIAAVVRALRIVQARWLRWRICVAAQKLSDAICRAEAESDTDEGRKSLSTALQTLRDSGFEVTVVDDDGNEISDVHEKE
jgi:biotin operon repressor